MLKQQNRPRGAPPKPAASPPADQAVGKPLPTVGPQPMKAKSEAADPDNQPSGNYRYLIGMVVLGLAIPLGIIFLLGEEADGAIKKLIANSGYILIACFALFVGIFAAFAAAKSSYFEKKMETSKIRSSEVFQNLQSQKRAADEENERLKAQQHLLAASDTATLHKELTSVRAELTTVTSAKNKLAAEAAEKGTRAERSAQLAKERYEEMVRLKAQLREEPARVRLEITEELSATLRREFEGRISDSLAKLEKAEKELAALREKDESKSTEAADTLLAATTRVTELEREVSRLTKKAETDVSNAVKANSRANRSLQEQRDRATSDATTAKARAEKAEAEIEKQKLALQEAQQALTTQRTEADRKLGESTQARELLVKDQEAALSTLRSGHEQAIAKGTEETRRLVSQHDAALSQLQALLDQVTASRNELERAGSEATKQHESAVAALQAEHELSVTTLRETVTRQEAIHHAELNARRDQRERETAQFERALLRARRIALCYRLRLIALSTEMTIVTARLPEREAALLERGIARGKAANQDGWFENGRTEGHTQGRKAGYQEGHSAGFEEGRQKGREEAREEIPPQPVVDPGIVTELRSANVGLKAELEAARQERDMARDAVRLQAISFAVPRDVPGPVREVAQNIDYYRRGSTGRDPLRRQVTQLTLAAKLGADVTREFEWEKRLASHCTWTATEYYCLLGVLANIITLSERESLTPNSSLFTEALTRELANTLTLVSGLHNMARKGEWARVTATLMRTGVVDNLHLARTLQTLPPRIASLLMKTWETMDREVSAVQFSARRNEVSEGQLD